MKPIVYWILLTPFFGLMTFHQGHSQVSPEEFIDPKNSRTTSIFTISPISFGTFYPGKMGGEVYMHPSGMRESTGSVILLPNKTTFMPAIFEIRAPSQTMIQVIYQTEVRLTGNEGGYLIFRPGPVDNGNPFITPPNSETGFLLTMGGVLELGPIDQNPSGNYSGSFHITLVNE